MFGLACYGFPNMPAMLTFKTAYRYTFNLKSYYCVCIVVLLVCMSVHHVRAVICKGQMRALDFLELEV